MKSNTLLLLALYLAAVVLAACLISPPLYWAGSSLADAGILPFLKNFPFHRYFSRSAQISALILLWPAFRAIGVTRLSQLGLETNPRRWRDLGTGLASGLGPVILLGAAYVVFEIYKFRADPSPIVLLRIGATAAAVGVIEEFLFRGVLLGLCLRVMPPMTAAVLSSAVFALVHFMRVAKPEIPIAVNWGSGFAQLPQLFSSAPPWPVLGWGILSLFIAGMLLAYVRLRTNSLFLAIGLHAGWILGQQGLQWIARYRIKPPEQLLPWVGPNVVSGAVPTGLVPVGALLIAGVILWVYLRRRTSRT